MRLLYTSLGVGLSSTILKPILIVNKTSATRLVGRHLK